MDTEELRIRVGLEGNRQASAGVQGLGTDVQEAGGHAEESGKKFKLMGKFIAGAAAVAVAAFAGGIAGLVSMDNAGAQLQAQLGLDSSSAAYGGKLAGQIYAQNYGESIGDAAGAIKSSVQNITGSLDDGGNEAAAKNLLNITSAFGSEADETSRAVGQLLRTNLVDNADQAFDLITRGFQSNLNAGGDLLDTVNEYSTQWRDLGINGHEALGLISQGLSGGARDSDLVADGLKELNIRVKTLDTNAAPALKHLGLNAYDMARAFSEGGPKAHAALGQILTRLHDVKDPAERARLSMRLFGTQSEDMAKALGKLNLHTATDQLKNVHGAADRMGQALGGSVTARIEAFKRGAIMKLTFAVGSVLIPALNGVGKAGAWFAHGLEQGKAPAIAIGVVAVMLATWFTGLAVAAGVASVSSFTLAGAMTAVNVAIRANPIVFIITLLVGLGLALVVAYKKVGWFRDVVNTVFHAIAWYVKTYIGVAKAVIGGLVSFVSALPGRISKAASGMWDGVKSGAKDAVNAVIGLFNSGFHLINGITPGAIKVAGHTIVPAIPDIPDIPLLAQGGNVSGAGTFIAGEAGYPEAIESNGRGNLTVKPLRGGQKQRSRRRDTSDRRPIVQIGTRQLVRELVYATDLEDAYT